MEYNKQVMKSKLYEKYKDTWVGTFVRFSCSSFVSELFDLAIFTIVTVLLKDTKDLGFLAIFGTVFIATFSARVCSSILNYILNRNLVFNKEGGLGRSIWRYVLVAGSKMFLSASFVSLFAYIFSAGKLLKTVIKIIVDGVLFVLGFIVQKIWVFKPKDIV